MKISVSRFVFYFCLDKILSVGKTSFVAYRNQVVIAVLASLIFIPFLGGVHLFDWDEINFAECAREMIVRHDYLVAP